MNANFALLTIIKTIIKLHYSQSGLYMGLKGRNKEIKVKLMVNFNEREGK